MASSLQEYTYYLDHLSKTGSSALLSRKEVKNGKNGMRIARFGMRHMSKYLIGFTLLEDIPTAEEMEPEYIKMVELQDKVKIHSNDLDLLKQIGKACQNWS